MIQKLLIALLKIIYKNDFQRMAICSKLIKAIEQEMEESADKHDYSGLIMHEAKIVDKPDGSKQDDGVFVDQHLWGGMDDCYYGKVYFPIKNQKFLCIPFDD